MRDGVDDRLAHDAQRILGRLLAGEAGDPHAAAHVRGHERLGLADLVGERAGRVVAQKLVAHLRAGVAHEGDLCVAQVALRLAAKQQDAGVGWRGAGAGPGQAAAGEQRLRPLVILRQGPRARGGRFPGGREGRAEFFQVGLHQSRIQIGEGRVGHGTRLEAGFAARQQQTRIIRPR